MIMTVAYVNIESAAQGTEDDKLAELLRETAMHHDDFEKATPFHNWWNWYARYLSARQHGSTPQQADAAADHQGPPQVRRSRRSPRMGPKSGH
jgi:hypothetical protein